MAPLSGNKERIYAIVHTISLHFAPPMLYVQYKHIYMLGNGGNKLFDYDRLRLIISLPVYFEKFSNVSGAYQISPRKRNVYRKLQHRFRKNLGRK